MDGILLINKPAGYTSHDIVGIVRKKLHTKKVGHCGTLDPDATGVLVVCVNKATKAIQFLMSDTKVYRATLSLGKSTDTYDASGKILEEKEVGQISKAQVIDVLNSFLGKSKQKPPIYSAIKVNGKKLYEYARNGEEVEIKERDIEIMMIELIDFSNNEILRFSKKFKDILNELIQKDYKLEKASVNFVVYWEKQEDKKEAKIVLPKVVFKKV